MGERNKCDFPAAFGQWSWTRLTGAILREVAFQLCTEIRREKEHKWFSQCWGCVKASKGDFAKMCASSRPDYRGCNLVNERYDKSHLDRKE
jgi:hypothetical protein